MTFPIETTQSRKSQYARVSLSDLTSGSALSVFDIPVNAVDIQVRVDVVTAFDSGTSDSITVDLGTDGHVFVNAQDGQATGHMTIAGQYVGGPLGAVDTLDLTWTGAGTAATEGEVDVSIDYIINGRADEVVS